MPNIFGNLRSFLGSEEVIKFEDFFYLLYSIPDILRLILYPPIPKN
jgi:hypothetical protein